jgi:hypothetical protein
MGIKEGEEVQDTCTLMFTAALFTTAKLWKQPRWNTTDKWIKKLYICTVKVYSGIKMNETVAGRCMDGIAGHDVKWN